MRMWSADPKKMCRKHLLGEHAEMHMFAGTINSGKSIMGYVKNNLLDPNNIERRHNLLADEMLARGYKHNSPISLTPNWRPCFTHPLDDEKSLYDLLERCPDCRKNYAS